MKSSLPKPFPFINVDDNNPAIRLFGLRFISEQTNLEYLTEFLGLIFFDKCIGNYDKTNAPFFTIKKLQEWSTENKKLSYSLPIKLNLKLLAFLSCSRIDFRHKAHKEHYGQLINTLKSKIRTNTGHPQEVIERVEELLRSYQGAGFNRNWCAKSFFPLSNSLIVRETIWNTSKAKDKNISWYQCIEYFSDYYSYNKRNFMARGGELLYLQLCNVFSKERTTVKSFATSLNLSAEESDLEALYESLCNGFNKINSNHILPFNNLINYIELLDLRTHERTNHTIDNLSCGWCPEESWPEGFLFAVEINRLLQAELDPVERLEMLMTGCVLQVLRSLCAQSMRYAGIITNGTGGLLNYSWLLSNPHSPVRQQRLASQRNLLSVQGLIYKALRNEALIENIKNSIKFESLYREADNKYGHKLFLSLGKKLGIIVPKTGPGARFIMTDSVLRYMVLVLLPPGKSCTYEDFLHKLYIHFGIAVEGEQLEDAIAWSGLPVNSSVQSYKDSWLADMLRAGGFMTVLSDACSIVSNTF